MGIASLACRIRCDNFVGAGSTNDRNKSSYASGGVRARCILEKMAQSDFVVACRRTGARYARTQFFIGSQCDCDLQNDFSVLLQCFRQRDQCRPHSAFINADRLKTVAQPLGALTKEGRHCVGHQLVLRLEMMKQRTARNAGFCDDALDGEPRITIACETAQRCLDEPGDGASTAPVQTGSGACDQDEIRRRRLWRCSDRGLALRSGGTAHSLR